MRLIDTHCHLDQEEFDADREQVVQAARDAGIEAIVTVGTTAESSATSVRLAATFDRLSAAVGIQPNYCAEAKPTDWDDVVSLVGQPEPCE